MGQTHMNTRLGENGRGGGIGGLLGTTHNYFQIHILIWAMFRSKELPTTAFQNTHKKKVELKYKSPVNSVLLV